MTDCERMAAQLERIALLLVGIDNRLAVIARSLAPPLYRVSDDGVLTLVTRDLIKGFIESARAFIDFDLAGHVDEPLVKCNVAPGPIPYLR